MATLRYSGLIAVAVLIALVCAGPAAGAPGDADPMFSEDGFAASTLGEAQDARGATSVAMDATADGRIVLGVGVGHVSSCLPTWGCAYELRPGLARFNPDGSLDASFAGDGELEPEAFPDTDMFAGVALNDLVVQDDGKTVLVGENFNASAVWVARFNPDGSPDYSFGAGSAAVEYSFLGSGDPSSGSDHASVAAIDDQGRILIGGRSDAQAPHDPQLLVARLLADGSLDPSFSGDGWLTEAPHDYFAAVGLELDETGRVLIAGERFGHGVDVFAYTPDGGRDPSFSGDGTAEILSVSGASEIAVDGLGRVLVLGQNESLSEREPELIRLSSSGELDPAFGDGGFASIEPPTLRGVYDYRVSIGALGVDAQARPLVAGGYGPHVLARFTESGDLDPSFSSDGWAPLFLRKGDLSIGDLLAIGDRIVLSGASGSIPADTAKPIVAVRRETAAPADSDADGMLDDAEVCPLIFGECPRLGRRITLGRERRGGRVLLRGVVRAPSTFCEQAPRLKLVRSRHGRKLVVRRRRFTGVIKIPAPIPRGRYRVFASPRVLDYGLCPKVRSPRVRIR